MSKKYALLVDLRKCVGCNSCQISCKMENSVPIGYFRARVDAADTGGYPDAKRHFLPKMCNNCEEPVCVENCPAEATYKNENGIVVIDRNLCIGCGRCVRTCPYGARFIHPYIKVANDPEKYVKDVPEVRGKKANDLKVADKCDYCFHLLAEGVEEPACVRNCVGKARVFGDIEDPNSEISKIMNSNETVIWHPELETEPKTFYIAPDTEVFEAADGQING